MIQLQLKQKPLLILLGALEQGWFAFRNCPNGGVAVHANGIVKCGLECLYAQVGGSLWYRMESGVIKHGMGRRKLWARA